MNKKSGKTAPSMLIAVGVFFACFGIFWTIIAGRMFPPMAIFGILWTVAALSIVFASYKAARNKAKKTHEHQEIYGFEKPSVQLEELRCPYCGAPVHESDSKCEYCGSRL